MTVRQTECALFSEILELLSYYHKGEVPGHLDACENPDCCQHCLTVRKIKRYLAEYVPPVAAIAEKNGFRPLNQSEFERYTR